MKLIIDIDKEIYNYITTFKDIVHEQIVAQAIANGTPYDTSGDLISREILLKAMEEERQYLLARGLRGAEHILVHHCLPLIDNAPTVKFSLLPADESKEEAYVRGYKKGKIEGILKANARPQGDIRWTDKLSVKSNGDIIDFECRVVGHINLEDMKGGGEND